jgi:hypothetical protein
MGTALLFPLLFRVQFWADLGGGSAAVGSKTSARQRLARDADRARFGCENWEHAGRENKFGGACKQICRSDGFVVSVPRIFLPQTRKPTVILQFGAIWGSARVALTTDPVRIASSNRRPAMESGHESKT